MRKLRGARLLVFALSVALGLDAQKEIHKLVAPGMNSPQSAQITIIECEGKACEPAGRGSPSWSFSSLQGTGQFGTGLQQMTIEHIDRESIAVRRVDITGPALGLTALYLGKIDGQRITGSVTYYDRDRPNSPRTDAWYGIMEGSTVALQSALHLTSSPPALPLNVNECEGNRCLAPGTPYSIVWTFSGKQGRGWVGMSERPLVLEHLDSRVLMVRRFDTDAMGGLTALYMGEIDGKRITGSVLYYDRSRHGVPTTDTWFGMIQDSSSINKIYARASAPAPAADANKLPTPSNVDRSRIDTGPSSSARPPVAPKGAGGYPPPPAGIPTSIRGRDVTQDLNGAWEGYYSTPAIPTVIQIIHSGNHVRAELLHDDLSTTGQAFFRGNFGPKVYLASIEVVSYNFVSAMTGTAGGTWNNDTLNVMDPDHVQIGNKPAFQRITMPLRNDFPCSSVNEAGIGAQWAEMRGRQAMEANDYTSAACWAYVAAVQGDANAQWILAAIMHDGKGVHPDAAQEFQWALRSAENGSAYGALGLAGMYEHGQGTAPDPAQAQSWRERGRALKLQQAREAAADSAQVHKQKMGMLELAAVASIGANLIADELKQSPDCDQDPARNSPSALRAKKSRVDGSGEHCEYGELVPNK